jgi:hypothetical protein
MSVIDYSRRFAFKRSIMLLCMIIITSSIFNLIYYANISAIGVQEPKQGKDLFIAVVLRARYPDQPALVNTFRSYLNTNDYIIAKPNAQNLKFVFQLPGLKGVEYFSLDEIKTNAAGLKSMGVNFISYDIEPEYSPSSDMADPVASVKSASDIVHKAGLLFMVSTTRNLDLQYASQFAPFADIYNPQGQALQSSPSEYASFYKDITAKIRTANPHIKILAQVSTLRGDLQSMQQSFSLVAPYVDGVIFWYGTTPEQLMLIKQFLNWLKP